MYMSVLMIEIKGRHCHSVTSFSLTAETNCVDCWYLTVLIHDILAK